MATFLITILYKSEDAISGFLGCLLAQDMTDWRLIVVDNASPDRSAEKISALGDSRVTTISNTANLGFAKAANQGLRAAMAEGGDFAVLMNNDVWFGPDFLRGLTDARDRLNADVITPRIMDMRHPEQSWYAGGHLESGWTFQNVHESYQDPGGDQCRTVEFATGCCLGLTRRALAQVGLLDESFFVYWEDVDFSMRLNAAGVAIHYVPEPMMLHEGASASGGAFSRSHTQFYYRSYMQLLRKHFGTGYALRIMVRLVGKAIERPNREFTPIRRMATAMAKGLVAPLVAPAQL